MRFEEYKEYSDVDLDKPFVTSGSHTYMIGRQDGGFLQVGEHIPYEMHGVWNHPHKWLDGFWFYVNGKPLTKNCVSFESLPYGSGHIYKLNSHVSVKRFQLCPNEMSGVVVSLTFSNTSREELIYNLDWVVRSELVRVWDFDWDINSYSKDKSYFDKGLKGYTFSDERQKSFVSVTCENQPKSYEAAGSFFEEDNTPGRGMSVKMTYSISIPANDSTRLQFIISGSTKSSEESKSMALKLMEKSDDYSSMKIKKYQDIFNSSKLTLPDEKLEKVYQWTKWHLDWLTRDVEGFGEGLGAGLPEYPWWFGCDNYYAIQGALATGFHDLSMKTLNLLRDYSIKHNGNGRIVHEITTEGKVINPGNTQETANYIVAVHKTFQFTGDLEFLKSHFNYMKLGIKWLYETMDIDGDMLPSGYGITEIEGLNVELIDTAVYGCEALLAMVKIGGILNDPMTKTYETMASKAKGIINDLMFLEELDLYADAMATPRMILSRIDKMINRMYELENAPEAGVKLKEMKKIFESLEPEIEVPVSIFKNWTISTPMETGIASEDLGLRALKAMENENFIGPNGIYLSGLMKTHMMTISTGVQAVAEARYGRSKQALARMKQITDGFSVLMPGSITEMSPGYGCYVQAWTNYGLAVPLIQYFFGVKPDAYNKKVVIKPMFPNGWSEAKLENMKIGDVELSIEMTEKAYIIKIDKSWIVEVETSEEDSREVIYK